MELTATNTNVSNPERWLSVVAGTAVAAFGLTRRSTTGIVAALLGGALVYRGATGHCHVYDALGISTATDDDGGQPRQVSVPYGKGVGVEKSVLVPASPAELYTFWRNFENLPRFMTHLEEVRVLDATRSHWKTKAPLGANVEWDAEVINEIPNELIAWRSVDNAQVRHAGSVHFIPAAGGTEVRVVLRYDPPGGVTGVRIAKLLGEDADHQVETELETLRSLFAGR